jgi:DNA repair exonuclease SbcCD ATPase subunit
MQAQGLGVGTPITDLSALRSDIKQLANDTSEADLRLTQTRLNTEIGGAQAAAKQHRQEATNAWQEGREQAARIGCEHTGPLLELAQAIVRFAPSMSAESAELDRLEGVARVERARMAEQAAGVNEPLDLSRLNSAVAEFGIEQRQMQARIAELPELKGQHLRARAVLSETNDQIAAAWSDVDERLARLEVAVPEREANTLRTGLQQEISGLDEPGTRTALDGAIGEIADADASIRQRQSQISDEQRGFVQHLKGVGLGTAEVDRPNLELLLPEIAEPDLPHEDALRTERDRLLGQLSYLHMTRRELESTLDLVGVVLDLVEAETELARQLRARLVKQRATSIITVARLNMINRVLPGTEQNLRLLLPQLTADRYCDAKLDPTYKLTVWDSAAQRYIEKDIFSGGTRDQFSLALRLAFALATLPQELGTTPGFIFLDEPLSAFDIPRTDALVELLTRGQISRSFAQIFLISHSRSFDPSLFGYYVRMEAGRVAETNLPRPVPENLSPIQPEPAAA